MLHQPALLRGRLHLHKSHRRPANRLADRLRIGRIVLVALDIGLHVLRWHQPNLMAEPRQLTGPVVRRGARFHANQAWRQPGEELDHLAAAKRLPDDHLLARINAVNLEHVLRKIKTNRGNLHVDGSLMWFACNDHPKAIRCRERAPSTTSTPTMKMIGMVVVAALAASAPRVNPGTTITATGRLTKSAISAGNRS